MFYIKQPLPLSTDRNSSPRTFNKKINLANCIKNDSFLIFHVLLLSFIPSIPIHYLAFIQKSLYTYYTSVFEVSLFLLYYWRNLKKKPNKTCITLLIIYLLIYIIYNDKWLNTNKQGKITPSYSPYPLLTKAFVIFLIDSFILFFKYVPISFIKIQEQNIINIFFTIMFSPPHPHYKHYYFMGMALL